MALASNCGVDPPAMDGGADANADAMGQDDTVDVALQDDTGPTGCTRTFTFTPGTTPDFDPMTVSPTRAAAGRLTAATLPANPSGLLEHRAGDFVLANDRVAALVGAARPISGYVPWGGKLIGLTSVRAGRLVDPADFNEAIVTLGRFTLRTESVSVINDGRDGMAAVVRAVGTTAAIPFIDEFARPLAGQPLGNLSAALEYRLEPGKEHVDVFVLVNSTRANPTPIALSLHGFFQRTRMPLYFENRGFVSGDTSSAGPQPSLSFVHDTSTSYAWIDPNGPLTPFLYVSGFDGFQAPEFEIGACEQWRRHVARVVIGGPGLDGLKSAVARTRMQTQREIRGNVTDAMGMPAAGARVHATSADGTAHLTRVDTDAMGNYVLHVPAGMGVRLQAWREGDGPSPTQDVPAATAMAALRLPAVGTLDIAVTDDTMTALPARILVEPVTGRPSLLPASHGEFTPGNNRNYVLFPVDGRANVRLPVGRYRVIAARGFEYEIASSEIDVLAGMTATVRPVIRRSVDSANIQCGDFHIHTNRSPDAPDPARYKIASLAADGVEVAVRTDHEYVMDFEPLIAEMNLGALMFGIPALELTTFTWGHFNVFPLTPNTAEPNNGIFQWSNRLPPAVFAEVRARPERPTIIINHPSSFAAGGAYFTAARLNPMTGQSTRPEYWDTDFSAVEVFNDSSFEENRMASVRDWFALLNANRRVFAVGSSDSHAVLPVSTTGYPRTCMYLGTDNPRMLSNNQVRDAVAQGRAVISGGALITATTQAGAVGPGQEASGVGPMAAFDVRVQAPTWVRLTELETIVNGVSMGRQPIPAAPAMSAERLRTTVNVAVPATGGWVIFVAHGLELTPIYPGRTAFGSTNPIFIRR
ncbi:MAG: CehA/McbA family metallohydrolase [Deltaproteobacteria bacterium]|nr:CehA/McbA family metallohydrolase [Deltaproteobacteria bacterium]